MPRSIIPLLAERLDISEEQVRPLLTTMVEELRQRAASDGVQLSGLGTFREEDGTLSFQPNPTLQRRVNRPYEGLSAESLSPGSDATSDPSPAPASSEDAAEPTPASAPETDQQQEEAAQDRTPARPDSKSRAPDSFAIISLVLVVLFLAGAGWFVVNQTNVWGPAQSSPPPTATETPSDQGDPSSTADSTVDSQPDRPSPPEDEASDVRDWTIVVASSPSRGGAQKTAAQYASQFDSVGVVSGTVDNTTWYRVTIGRYASESAAERVLSERTEALPSDAWTHRLE